MSKGHGRIERAILHALSMEQGPMSMGTNAETLARYAAATTKAGHPVVPYSAEDPYAYMGDFDYIPTRSELESVRRALRNLRKQGLVLGTQYRHVIYKMPGKKPKY